MARFQIIRTHIVNSIAYPPGTTFATDVNSRLGDERVWFGFTVDDISDAMIPLDDMARYMVSLSRYPNGPSDPFPAGASSIAG